MRYYKPKTFCRWIHELLGDVFCDKHKKASNFLIPLNKRCEECYREDMETLRYLGR